MGKRHKNHAKPASKPPRQVRPAAESDEADDSPAIVPYPPAKQPVILGISIVLFVLWFIFLLVTAWPG
jgi:hypothetical protein